MIAPFISNDSGVLAVLLGVCAFFFLFKQLTNWKLFDYLPPLIFIYLTPVILTNTGVIPPKSAVYTTIGELGLPVMLVLLLLHVDVLAAVRVMGKGVFVMLMGTMGVVIGAPIGYFIVQGGLENDGWKAFSVLAGSWIGGTGNMAAMSEMTDAKGTPFGLAVLADTTIYILWLPLLLASKNLAPWFNRFTGVSDDRIKKMEQAAKSLETETTAPKMEHYLYLLFLAVFVTWIAGVAAERLPEVSVAVNSSSSEETTNQEKPTRQRDVAEKPKQPARTVLVSRNTWRILLVTTLGILLSFTPAKRIPGSHLFAMAIVYLFVARMGATAELAGVASQAIPFLLGSLVMIFIHGAFCLLGAWLFRVDVHTAAIASAANIGGAASAPIVAAHHHEKLVPASILMALIGYAVGNYAAYLASILCRLVSL